MLEYLMLMCPVLLAPCQAVQEGEVPDIGKSNTPHEHAGTK